MSIELHLLNSTNHLDKYKNSIRTIFGKACKQSQALLELDQVDVVVRHSPKNAIPELGIGGFTDENGHTVYISVDIDKGFKAEDLYSQLLHELYHAKRFQQLKMPRDFAGDLVSEGLACLFEEEQTEKLPIYAKVKINNELIATAKKQLSNTKYDRESWFFGSKRLDIPRWFGYTYGYQLCKEYSKKTNKNAHQLVDTPTKNILPS